MTTHLITLVVFWICAALAAAIFGVMLWSVATFKDDRSRKRSDAVAASYLHSRLVEVLWALIPIAIFLSAALPAQRMLTANSQPDDDRTQLAASRD
jgi:cytochrome c oxidase subunit 2